MELLSLQRLFYTAAACVGLSPLVLGGCATIPRGQTAVDAVSIEGTDAVSSSDIEEKLATTPSPRFLGLFRGVIVDYELFDRFVFQRDLARVERFYQARGYYEAHARAGRVESTSNHHVRVSIIVEEGPAIHVAGIKLNGVDSLPTADTKAGQAAVDEHTRVGKVFDEEDFAAAEDALQHALANRGYAFAKVKRSATIDIAGHAANLTFDVVPDQVSTFGDVQIEGLGPLPEDVVRRALDIQPGSPYSLTALDAAQQAVLDLGVFSAVDLRTDLPTPPPPNHVVPIKVHLEATKLHSVLLGGGVEFDDIKTDVHLRAGWEDCNFLGGLRNLRIQTTPGVVLYPTRVGDLRWPQNLLLEEKSRVEFRQPGFIEARTHGLLRAEYNVYPVILDPSYHPDEAVLGYQEAKASAGLDRTIWKLYGNVNYNIQANFPFAYLGSIDPSLRSVVVSYIDLLTHFDFRDDPIHTHKGLYIGNELQLAGGPLGGDARDIRIQPEVRGYVPFGKRITLAVRGSVGFLFPSNYGDSIESSGGIPPSANDRSAWNRDVQINFFRAFFSGGSTSNRGYPLRGVGPHGPVPFLNPQVEAQQLAKGCRTDPTATGCQFPLGGYSLWEASAEVRVGIHGPLSAVAFCDTSNVAAKRAHLNFSDPHLACGPGVRYDTPVGPIRLDVGFRLERSRKDDPENPGDPIAGVPFAAAFGIGEAF